MTFHRYGAILFDVLAYCLRCKQWPDRNRLRHNVLNQIARNLVHMLIWGWVLIRISTKFQLKLCFKTSDVVKGQVKARMNFVMKEQNTYSNVLIGPQATHTHHTTCWHYEILAWKELWNIEGTSTISLFFMDRTTNTVEYIIRQSSLQIWWQKYVTEGVKPLL